MKILTICLLWILATGFNRPDPPHRRTFSRFLDSLCQQPGVVIKKTPGIARKEKIYPLPGGGRWDRIRDLGLVRQYYQHVATKENPFWWPRYSLLMLGTKLFATDTFAHWQEFRYVKAGKMVYGQSSFVALSAGPPDDCNGVACRTNSYPVIGMYKSDTSIYTFVNVDDVAGLNYGDFNHDGYLDFLDIESLFFNEDAEMLSRHNKKFDRHSCERGVCYKIMAVTYRKGKWERLKDRQGREYAIWLTLDDVLNPDATFKLLMSRWM
ncbi:hypothetical protein [Chitinophaga varians]|uniref:hypothetical protein n=1 Tax=Chitinophaga varians TaxID=2202339 RepID=UPI00165F7B12|nr:hypothetical protein [Chitinophaga varians]MBC9914023.1 hypothetical protein [Chitinophaga varians]